MLDQYNPLIHPSNSHSSIGVVSQHMFDPYDEKVNPSHLYVCQPHAIQIIQLVEGPPPPPRISSPIESSSAGSSSGSSYPSTSDSEDDNCSSYCSSYVTPSDPSQDREPVVWTDDTYHVRMKRISVWRNNSLKAMSPSAGTSLIWLQSTLPHSNISIEPRSSSLKRKLDRNQTDDDSVGLTAYISSGTAANALQVSHSPKRSRSRDPQSPSRLFGHSCTACDTPFSSRQSLRQHGRILDASEACRTAVEYDFE